MNDTQRKTIEGWIDKASNQLQTAREHAKSSYRCSEAVQAAQECIELSVKSVLSLLRVKYPKAHEWASEKEPFAAIARQIQEKKLLEKLASRHLDHTIPLPRLLLLMNFWGQFYLASKYGFEVEHLASARDLFRSEEANVGPLGLTRRLKRTDLARIKWTRKQDNEDRLRYPLTSAFNNKLDIVGGRGGAPMKFPGIPQGR